MRTTRTAVAVFCVIASIFGLKIYGSSPLFGQVGSPVFWVAWSLLFISCGLLIIPYPMVGCGRDLRVVAGVLLGAASLVLLAARPFL